MQTSIEHANITEALKALRAACRQDLRKHGYADDSNEGLSVVVGLALDQPHWMTREQADALASLVAVVAPY